MNSTRIVRSALCRMKELTLVACGLMSPRSNRSEYNRDHQLVDDFAQPREHGRVDPPLDWAYGIDATISHRDRGRGWSRQARCSAPLVMKMPRLRKDSGDSTRAPGCRPRSAVTNVRRRGGPRPCVGGSRPGGRCSTGWSGSRVAPLWTRRCRCGGGCVLGHGRRGWGCRRR